MSVAPTVDDFFESIWVLLPSHKNDVKKDVKPTRRKALKKIGYEKIKKACERYLNIQDCQFLHRRDNFFNKIIDTYLDENYQEQECNSAVKNQKINIKNDRFANFPQRKWDFEAIEKAGREELRIP